MTDKLYLGVTVLVGCKVLFAASFVNPECAQISRIQNLQPIHEAARNDADQLLDMSGVRKPGTSTEDD
jgi:hypothetical protein